MKNPHGSDLSLFQRASIRHEMINRIHDVFDKAGMEVELSEDDIKFIMTSYLNLFTGKEWHLSSSVTLHGDIEIRQEIQAAEGSDKDKLIHESKAEVLECVLEMLIYNREFIGIPDVERRTCHGIKILFSDIDKNSKWLESDLKLLATIGKTWINWREPDIEALFNSIKEKKTN